MASALSALAPKLSHNRTPVDFSCSRAKLSFLTHGFSSLTVSPRKSYSLSFTSKSTDREAPVIEFAAEDSVPEGETSVDVLEAVPESEPAVEEPKREEVFAVVMITLNKVLLVGTKTRTYIGKPIVPNATVQAVVEEQTKDKVVVFKYKKKKNYRRNIGHRQVLQKKIKSYSSLTLKTVEDVSWKLSISEAIPRPLLFISTMLCSSISWLGLVQVAQASEGASTNVVYEVAELFELGIQLSYLLLLLALLGVGSFFVIRQVLVRRELDLSAKELQEQVRSGDASATELFELGAVMLRRKFYPAATKYLLQAIEKWDGDEQDLAQVHNALGVTYVRDGKIEKSITEFENAVKIQPGYVTAWNNLGDAYEKTNNLKSALRAFEEVLLLDPNNKVARPRRDVLKDKVDMYKGVPVKSKKK